MRTPPARSDAAHVNRPAARCRAGPSRRGPRARPAISRTRSAATRPVRRALRSAQHHDSANNLAVIASTRVRRAVPVCRGARVHGGRRGSARRFSGPIDAREVGAVSSQHHVLHDLFVSRRAASRECTGHRGASVRRSSPRGRARGPPALHGESSNLPQQLMILADRRSGSRLAGLARGLARGARGRAGPAPARRDRGAVRRAHRRRRRARHFNSLY